MKPNGLVEAASSTLQTSMPMPSKMTLSSLTRAILTQRNIFSVNLTASAARVEVTGTVTDPDAAIRAASDALDRGDGARLLDRLAAFGRSIGGAS